MPVKDRNFAWLNRGGRWLGHHWKGLDLDTDGVLHLSGVPRLAGGTSDTLAELPAPGGPAGVAVDAYGTIYYADPGAGRVRRVDACDGSYGVVPRRFHTPGGLLYLCNRGALAVAESGNHRIEVVDPATGGLTEFWGDGVLDTPWTLAAGDNGAVYVVDHGRHSVQKFDFLGTLESSFWTTLQAAQILTDPVDIAAGPQAVYIADAAAHAIFVVDPSGNPLLDSLGKPVSFGADQLVAPLGMAIAGNALFAGDNSRHGVLQFDLAGGYGFVGEAVGYQGPVAGLAIDGRGGLLVHTGGSLAPVVLSLGQGYRRQGIFWSDVIHIPGEPVAWHSLESTAAVPAPDAHLQLFFHTSNQPADAPNPPVLQPGGGNPFTDPKWRALPPDVVDGFLGGAPASFLWVGAWFSGDGLASASLAQIHVNFNQPGYLASLPAIYRKPGVCRDFLLRLLALFESFNDETENAIAVLPSLFDPWAAPAGYLPWLAGWLALPLDEDWDEQTRRREIAEAFLRYARRGTPAALRQALKDYAGVDAIVQEPLLNAAWWALPAPAGAGCSDSTPAPAAAVAWQSGENSILGFTTMLAPAEPQGAVVGTSAVLDRSHLISESQFGEPLFVDVAYQFSVQVYRGQLNCPAALAAVRAVIEREKPAHTTYHLCVLEPQMRVGFQARVGIDAIVGGPLPAMRLGETPALGNETALGGRVAARLGERSRIGQALVG